MRKRRECHGVAECGIADAFTHILREMVQVRRYWQTLKPYEKMNVVFVLLSFIFYIAAVAEKSGRNDDVVVDNLKLVILIMNLILFTAFLVAKRHAYKLGILSSYGLIWCVIIGLLIYNYTIIAKESELEDEGEEDGAEYLRESLLEDTISITITTLLDLLYLFVYMISKHSILVFATSLNILFNLISVIAAMNQTSDEYIDIANLTSLLAMIVISFFFYSGRFQVFEEKERFDSIFQLVNQQDDEQPHQAPPQA
jgi:hypothetical protein